VEAAQEAHGSDWLQVVYEEGQDGAGAGYEALETEVL
jgi:hypothetical protein